MSTKYSVRHFRFQRRHFRMRIVVFSLFLPKSLLFVELSYDCLHKSLTIRPCCCLLWSKAPLGAHKHIFTIKRKSSASAEMHSGSVSTWQPTWCPWITVQLNVLLKHNELVIISKRLQICFRSSAVEQASLLRCGHCRYTRDAIKQQTFGNFHGRVMWPVTCGANDSWPVITVKAILVHQHYRVYTGYYVIMHSWCPLLFRYCLHNRCSAMCVS